MNGFKQAGLVLINSGSIPDETRLQDKLKEFQSPPLFSATKAVEGFSAPYKFSADFVYAVAGSAKICLTKTERLLPNTVVTAHLSEKIAKIQEEENRIISKREKKELKETVYRELLARAFIKESHCEALYNREPGFLFINQSSRTQNENFLTKLREALSGLEVKFPETVVSAAALMTSWLKQNAATGKFTLDNYCELKKKTDTASTVKFAKHDLPAREVNALLERDRFVSQLGLVWDDKIQFILDDTWALKRLKFLDLNEGTIDNIATEEEEDPILKAEAEQLLLTESLSAIYSELIELAGSGAETGR